MRYAIGDIQGCYNQFMRLIAKINFNPSVDTLYLVGDLVNRGPDSLKVLQWVYKHQNCVITVLGNHDIYLLSRYNKLVKPDDDDTLSELLSSKHASKLVDWLRNQSLIVCDNDYIVVHAGIYPILNLNKTLQVNEAIKLHLSGNDYAQFLRRAYGNKPNYWDDEFDLYDQMKFMLNCCTRMRFIDKKTYALDYKNKARTLDDSTNLIPWFRCEFDHSINKKIIFGHWAAIGVVNEDKFISLDTGCVWGRKLTAFNLDTTDIIQVNYNEE